MKKISKEYIIYGIVFITAIIIIIAGGLLLGQRPLPEGCVPGGAFSSSTGAKCNSRIIPSTQGCLYGAKFNTVTGQACPTVSTSTPLFPFSNPSRS